MTSTLGEGADEMDPVTTRVIREVLDASDGEADEIAGSIGPGRGREE